MNMSFVNVKKWYVKFLFLALSVTFFQNCKTYHDSISLSEAAEMKSENLYKVTLFTGEELIVENIDVDNGLFFGTSIKEDKKERILFEESKVNFVQEVNPKLPKSINGTGIAVGLGSIVLAVLMFGT